jgi:hypothetical protein
MEAWRIHFENLATPNLDENKFDLERNSLCTIQNDIIARSVYPSLRRMLVAVLDAMFVFSLSYPFFRFQCYCSIFPYPDTLKRGIITPVLKKKKDNTLPGNYRGIVVTNTFSKIVEVLNPD